MASQGELMANILGRLATAERHFHPNPHQYQ
jgi:hypothetical protein